MPQDYPRSVTADADHEVQHAVDVATEALAADALQIAANHVAAVVGLCPSLWRWGDGYGGLVLTLVALAVEDRLGLEVAPAPQPVTPRVQRLAQRDDWACHYCDRPLGWGHPCVTPPEVEHVIPRAQGGNGRMANLVLACAPCNNDKGARTPMEWLGRPCCPTHA